MFRHPDLNNINGAKNDFNNKIDQSIRYFKVPNTKDKEDVLDNLMRKIAEQKDSTVSQTKVRKLLYTVSSVAAVGLVFFALYFFFAFETYTGDSQQFSNVFYLPDNSRVILTEGSTLRYSTIYFNRNVKLKGEAYFEVKSGEDFYVNSRQGTVAVLGTRFRVNDIANSLTVQCYEGAVGVNYANEKVKISEGMLLKGINSKIEVVDGKGKDYPDYARFTFNCRNKNINEIWPEIEQYFGVNIHCASINENKSFTGSINAGNIHDVLDIICTSMKLDYTVDKNGKVAITSH